MEYILPIAVLCAFSLICAFAEIFHRRHLVQNLVWSLLNDKGTGDYWVSFMDSSPEQLLYPLTSEQLAIIRACRSFERTTAEVKGIRLLEGMLNSFYFTVHYDIRGTTVTGETFTIQEDAYLRVCFLRHRIIHWIVGSRTPF